MGEVALVACPFCGEEDFDLLGLKIHLTGGWIADPCNAFGEVGEEISAGSEEDGESSASKASEDRVAAEEPTPEPWQDIF